MSFECSFRLPGRMDGQMDPSLSSGCSLHQWHYPRNRRGTGVAERRPGGLRHGRRVDDQRRSSSNDDPRRQVVPLREASCIA